MLKVIAGLVEPTKGSVEFQDNNEGLSFTQQNAYYSFSSPELELFKDLLVSDILDFHFQFKKCKLQRPEFLEVCDLQAFLSKQYSELSSGLKNKLKLSLALFSDTPILFLDEPCTNFDEVNTMWYQDCIEKYCSDQMIIVASNQEQEYSFCEKKIQLIDYKK